MLFRSKRIASASSAAGIRPSTLKVLRSNITTDLSSLEVANPCPVASAIAVPCAPWTSATSPSNFYDVPNVANLPAAFQQIAGQIGKLRLAQ